jgi:hypothetical protein
VFVPPRESCLLIATPLVAPLSICSASPGFEPLLSMLMKEAEELKVELAKLKKERQVRYSHWE